MASNKLTDFILSLGHAPVPSATSLPPMDSATLNNRYGIESGTDWVNIMISRPNTKVGIWAVDSHSWTVLTDLSHRLSLFRTAPPELGPNIRSLPVQTIYYPNGSEVHFERRDSSPYFSPPHQSYDGSWFCGASNIDYAPEKRVKEIYTPIFRNNYRLGLVYVT